MTTKDLLETLSNCKCNQRYLAAKRFGEPLPKPKPIIIDWKERKVTKDKIFKKYIRIAWIIFLFSLVLIVFPLFAVHLSYGKAILASMPPMFLMALSWMVAAWWAWDKDRLIFMALTLGAMPLRMGLGLAWCWFIIMVPSVDIALFVFSAMAYWVMFTSVEIAMVCELSNKLVSTSQLEPPS